MDLVLLNGEELKLTKKIQGKALYLLLYSHNFFANHNKYWIFIHNRTSKTHFFQMVPKARIELASDPYQGPVLPLNYIGMVPIERIELSTYSLRESCSTPELNRR